MRSGLDTELSPTTMSGGERQRVAPARALVADAELLLLDKATAQLDGLSEAGKVRSVGTHEELLDADELYRELSAALRIATPRAAVPEPVTTP